MASLENLFSQYTELRLSGKSQEVVFRLLRDAVVSKLTREERNDLAAQCKRWERERTQPDLTHAQREAVKRAALTNITLKVTFCPACDTPNANGVTRCQVCNEPLAVSHVQKSATTGIKRPEQGSVFERNSVLELHLVSTQDRLQLEPQMSPTGIKIGRAVGGAICDLDLEPFGGGDYGVSRQHAVIRYDKSHSRVVIIDNNSTNGTYINGVRLPSGEETTLADGDEMQIARMQFMVKFK